MAGPKRLDCSREEAASEEAKRRCGIDADDRECDPYAIPPGFLATTIAIHLGKRIGRAIVEE